jgi:spore coat protein CotF
MPRASSVLPLVNSSGHQEVNISNTSLAVNDTTAQSSLSAINGKITACDTSAVTVSSSALPVGGSTSANQSTANSSLSSIDSKITACDTSAVTVSSSALPSGASSSANQATANSSLASIDSKLTGPISVSSSVTISGSHGNMSNASSVASGDFSTSVDISGKGKSSIMVDLDSSDSVEIWVSGDGGSNFNLHGSIYPQSSVVGSPTNYYAYLKLDGDCISDVKLKYTASGTVTASCYSRV